jgi:hypothetical protein
MAAPATRTINNSQVAALRSHRRDQGGIVYIVHNMVMVFVRHGQLYLMATAICGPRDSFDPEAGELFARERLDDGQYAKVEPSAMSELMYHYDPLWKDPKDYV